MLVLLFLFSQCFSQYVSMAPNDQLPQLINKILNKTHVESFTMNPLTICHGVDAMLDMKSDTIYTSLAGFLGRGYDPYTSVSYMYVLEEKFTTCGRTPDYRFYIPDNSIVEMIMVRQLDKSSEMSETFEQETSNTEAEIEAGASKNDGKGKIGGKGSLGFQKTKTEMTKKKKSEFRFTMLNTMYRLSGDRSATPAAHFQYRLQPIIEAIRNEAFEKARYLVQQIITDYGTHVTSEVLIGTKVQQRVYISSSVTESTTEIKLKAKAQVDANLQGGNVSANGGAEGAFGEGEGSSELNMEISTWVQGGSKFEKITSENFADLIDDQYPVALSSSIQPIYMFMQNGLIKGADHYVARKLREFFEDAVNEYFERNTFYGCTDPSSANFDFQANVDDNTCQGNDCEFSPMRNLVGCEAAVNAKENLTAAQYFKCAQNIQVVIRNHEIQIKECNKYLNVKEKMSVGQGSMFQTCVPSTDSLEYDREIRKLNLKRKSPCENLATTNFLTNKNECPADNEPYRITTYTYVLPTVTYTYDNYTCINDKCVPVTAVITIKDRVTLESFWCGPQNKNDFNGIKFNGYFDIGQVNNFNGEAACPVKTIPIVMFQGTTLCIKKTKPYGHLSASYGDIHKLIDFETSELTLLYSSKSDTTHCHLGHSRQLITVVNGEKIYACILKRKGYYGLNFPAVIRGPYLDKRWAMEDGVYNTIEIFDEGVSKNTTFLGNIDNKIVTYIMEHMNQKIIKAGGDIEPKNAKSFDNFFKKHAIAIISGFVLLILCIFAIVYAINCV